jgi:hypothetical protein
MPDRSGAVERWSNSALHHLLVGEDLRCPTPILTGRTDPAVACSAFERIRCSRRDTDATIRAVEEHNAAGTKSWDG